MNKEIDMHVNAKKLKAIEEILKVENEEVLDELIRLISKSKQSSTERPSIKDFVGIWTPEEADEIKRVIDESCGQVNPDDWK